ncbi:MAG: phospho-N-acetylmuramoyl-pentapeptide-transferase [Candidatus Omnitrophica bacterium]|nr:phospho-N-acetylmuramoyl-pentapeptide-transferase [Candidatus Omnitrophota bacterium]MBU2044836.1 phospho-N-acetylmuramoyl-pentapeptide-transferase [Candidatus Omnitrophota bacterium]MBU2266129.1 phospho-N-acetylmuramoyl-pentapeptide-transferase [Candidatus Omnitrophota bacterium]MBU2473649.1 phospho-N-acetylmuramoyl-pentapeptide-transferase [Candidatus Omnitrophota bacterium]
MIYHIFYPLAKYLSVFNITKYITFRGGCAFITSFILVMLFWKFTLKRLKNLKIIERVDMYGHIHLESLHNSKKGTPTMGGILIIFSMSISTILWARWDSYLVLAVLLVLLSLGLVGLRDDFLKIKRGQGLSRRQKLIAQSLVGVLLGIVLLLNKDFPNSWNLPFLKNFVVDLGYFYIFWSILMVIATSNAVNFTDGLDGLAIGAVIINSLIFGILSYVVGHIGFANYLFIPYIEGAGELTVFCLSLMGAGLAFLWFNSYPAEVFMGDVGALALGGALGTIALLIKQEFLLFISGGLFVLEALSVILQILSVRLRGKKIFLAAPLHHHLQLLGWKEPKIIIRLWIVSIICAIAALLTLKIR